MPATKKRVAHWRYTVRLTDEASGSKENVTVYGYDSYGSNTQARFNASVQRQHTLSLPTHLFRQFGPLKTIVTSLTPAIRRLVELPSDGVPVIATGFINRSACCPCARAHNIFFQELFLNPAICRALHLNPAICPALLLLIPVESHFPHSLRANPSIYGRSVRIP